MAEFLRWHVGEIRIGDNRRLAEVDYQHRLGRVFGEFNLDVDFVLTHDTPGTSRSFLVDTKYKALDVDESYLDLAQDDFYRMCAYVSVGRCRYDDIILLYPATNGERRSFAHADLRLHVRQFDPQAIYDLEHQGAEKRATVAELSRALPDNHVVIDQ